MLGLQEATVLGMAEGFAQGNGRTALVNLHTGPGLGNAMGEGIDFVGVAKGLGVDGELVEKDGDLLPAIKRALNAGRPYLLDVVVDRKVPELLK